MPHSSGKEAEGTGDVCSEPIGALIDLNLATWPCKCPGGSIETDFVWASTVTSGWRGVVTPLSLFGSSSPDHTDSLEQQQRARGDGGCQGRLHTLRFRRLGQFFNIHSEVEASCQGRRRTYGCSGWTASDLQPPNVKTMQQEGDLKKGDYFNLGKRSKAAPQVHPVWVIIPAKLVVSTLLSLLYFKSNNPIMCETETI